MKREELCMIKDQMNDLFNAHRQMTNIYKSSTIKLLSRVIDNEVIFNEPIEIIFRGKIFTMTSVVSEKDSFVKIRGSLNCCSGTSCSISDKTVELDLNSLGPDEVIEIGDKIIRNL